MTRRSAASLSPAPIIGSTPPRPISRAMPWWCSGRRVASGRRALRLEREPGRRPTSSTPPACRPRRSAPITGDTHADAFFRRRLLSALFAATFAMTAAWPRPPTPMPRIVTEARPPPAAGRRQAVPDARRAGEQLQRLAGHVAQGVAGDRGDPRQHRAGADRLGADRADRRPFRFRLSRHAGARRRASISAAGAAVVRHLEEQRPQLRAALGEDWTTGASRAC